MPIATVRPDSIASLPAVRCTTAVTIADMIGMPMVMPTCWLIVASPVARPCSRSGTPVVTVTMNPTIATRLATPPTKVATRTSAR